MKTNPVRSRLTSAHAIALLALFVALGGGAYAALRLPRNSVGTTQIKRGAVTPAKLSKKARKALTGRAGATGAAGAQGAAGTSGAPGAPGATGPSDAYVGGSAAGAIPAALTQIVAVTVPAGSYTMSATLTDTANGSGEDGLVECFLSPSEATQEGSWDHTSVYRPGLPTGYSSMDIGMSGAATFAAAQTIRLVCQSFGAHTSGYINAHVTATQTGSLHGTVPPPS